MGPGSATGSSSRTVTCLCVVPLPPPHPQPFHYFPFLSACSPSLSLPSLTHLSLSRALSHTQPSAVIREQGRYKGEEPGASLEPICAAFSTTINSSTCSKLCTIPNTWGRSWARAPTALIVPSHPETTNFTPPPPPSPSSIQLCSTSFWGEGKSIARKPIHLGLIRLPHWQILNALWNDSTTLFPAIE